ncbi:MAG TPA: hydroxymethylbilane synthase [Actinomycetota bacterium]
MTGLRIGTRRSALALAQAEEVRIRLAEHGVDGELVPLATAGDEDLPRIAGTSAGLKGLWTDAIVDALIDERIDLAVHSAKDLPAEDEDALTIGAVPPRADPSDVLVLREEGVLPAGASVGTDSVRRRAQLLAAFPGIAFVGLRGNVDTRLRKLEAGEADAAVLAAAGLARLGLRPPNAHALELDVMVPAPGQGALAVQCRQDDAAALEALARIDDPHSHHALDAERSVMWRLGGGCALPLGAFAVADHGRVHLTAVVATPDGATILRSSAEARFAEEAAEQVTKGLIAQGAEAILAEVTSGATSLGDDA